ncbi:MAG: glycosyltransferase [Thermodesulfobacteriota bacterium]|nr:glycosyltransferase [Thermodesulfobacteriota bacterium]
MQRPHKYQSSTNTVPEVSLGGKVRPSGHLPGSACLSISAIICTHNRAQYLSKAIGSLTQQTLDKSLYEIIIVDNCSTDSTKDVVTGHCSDAIRPRYIYESALGLSRARNTGLEAANGQYVAYLDDDAIACRNWLEKIVNLFDSTQPKLGCVCGKVEPIWEAPRPPWLSDKVAASLTIVDWSNEPVALSKDKSIAGANMAFPNSVLTSVGGFEEKLGRKGNKLLSMEEFLLRQQLQSLGYSCHYHPEIAVRHHVPASRLNKSWFFRRFYWQGVSKAIARAHFESITIPKRISVAISAAKKLMGSPLPLIGLAASTDGPDDFTQKCFTLARIGYIFGLLGAAR